MRFLEKIDLFSQNINFTLQKSDKIQTQIGGLLTLVYIAAGIFVFFENGKEVFLKEKPITFQDVSISSKYLDLVISNKTFPFSFQITDNSGNVLNLTNYLDISVSIQNYTSEGVGFPISQASKNVRYQLQNPKSNNSNFILENGTEVDLTGSWNINSVNTLSFIVSLCNNNTSSSCATRDEIFDLIGSNGLCFNFYYPEINLQLGNFKDPINSNVINAYFYLTKNSKFTQFYFRMNQITTDYGVIFSEKDVLKYLTVDSLSTDTSILGEHDLTLYTAYFYTTNKSIIINRSYITMQQVLSQVGGLLNLVYLVFILVSPFFAEMKKNLIIMNSIFQENEISHNINNNNSKVSLETQIKNSRINNYLNNFENPASQKKRVKFDESVQNQQSGNIILKDLNNLKKEKTFKHKLMKNIDLSLSYLDMFKNIFCKYCEVEKSADLNCYQLLSKIIDYYCDIVNFIRKFEEIEKLKLLLLDENQLKIFNNLKSKIRDIDEESLFYERSKNDLDKLMKNICVNPKNKIDESMRKHFM